MDTYELIPEFDQETEFVVQLEPVDMGDHLLYPCQIVRVRYQDEEAAAVLVSECAMLKAGLLNKADMIAAGWVVITPDPEAEKAWYLVHDGVSVLDKFETSGVVESKLTVVTAATKADCEKQVEKLGLEVVAVNVFDVRV